MNPGLFLTAAIVVLSELLCAGFAAAQSTSQDFPTPVTSNEIGGTIKARDIGDSRLTTYFYTFNGNQGDVFINVVTRNFTGDLDVFTAAGLRSVTKIVIYANDSENETGRAVYFRKTEKLLLRLQGRSPNDDPASFRIKFAGSFVAAKESDVLPEPELPTVTATSASGIRVNSVGTILPPLPKPVTAKSDATEVAAIAATPKKDEQTTETTGDQPKTGVKKPTQVLKIAVTDPTSNNDDAAATTRPPSRRTPASRRRRPPVKTTEPKPPPDVSAATTDVEILPVKKSPPKRTAKKPKVVKDPDIDPLASIRLVIVFKDGRILEKTMSEVFKFSVDKGILTVILKDGSISRYPIVEVAKVTIE